MNRKRKVTTGKMRSNKMPRTATGEITNVLASRGFRFPYYRRKGKKVVGELKVADSAAATARISTTYQAIALCAPQLGTDFSNRIGRKIRLRSVMIRGYMGPTGTFNEPMVNFNTAGQTGRIIIGIDYQPNGALPLVGDVIQGGTAGSAANTVLPLNLNNRDRFKIIFDKVYSFGPAYIDNLATTSASAAFGGIQNRYVKLYKKIDEEVIFNAGNAGTIADINSGALFIAFYGDNASGANDISFVYQTRVRFTDV